mgnify:CR=1 FL=1|tara:strand:+ start:11554 stop:12078 length:525 start_codon:yes stop_codon:yes gene_type:complete
MNIILVGYRAAGKSTIGKELATKLNFNFYDVDRFIEPRITPKTLSEFYLEVGEEGFRPLETEIVLDLCNRPQSVISLGAGSLMRKKNQQAAKKNAQIIYIKVPAKDLWSRIQLDPNSKKTRPNLAGGGFKEVETMLKIREPDYLSCSNLIVDGTMPISELVEQIILFCQSNLRI